MTSSYDFQERDALAAALKQAKEAIVGVLAELATIPPEALKGE